MLKQSRPNVSQEPVTYRSVRKVNTTLAAKASKRDYILFSVGAAALFAILLGSVLTPPPSTETIYVTKHINGDKPPEAPKKSEWPRCDPEAESMMVRVIHGRGYSCSEVFSCITMTAWTRGFKLTCKSPGGALYNYSFIDRNGKMTFNPG